MSQRLQSDSAEAKNILQEQVRNLERSRTLFLKVQRYSGFSIPFRFLSAVLIILAAGVLVIQAHNLTEAAMRWLSSTGRDSIRGIWMERMINAVIYALASYMLVGGTRIVLLLRSNAIYSRGVVDAKRRIDQLNKQISSVDDIAERIERMIAVGDTIALYLHRNPQVNDGAPKALREADVRENSTQVDPLLKLLPFLLEVLLTVCLWLGTPSLFLSFISLFSLPQPVDYMKLVCPSNYVVPVALGMLYLKRRRRGISREFGIWQLFCYVLALAVYTAVIGIIVLVIALNT